MKKLVLSAFLAIPVMAFAAELADGWTQTGSAEMTVGGETMTLLVAEHPDARPFVVRRNTGGLVTINAEAAGLNDAGAPDGPFVSFILGPYSGNALPGEASFQLFTANGILAADVDTGSSVALSDATISDDGALSFTFEGTAVPVENKDGIFAPIEGGAPVTVSGTFSGKLAE
ncbi:MAG: hypothetical protein AAF762_14550 [Pseudomonadota bacterium]